MVFDVNKFKGLIDGGARPTLFDVEFHNIGEASEIMRYLVKRVAMFTHQGQWRDYQGMWREPSTVLTFTILEREDCFVADHLEQLDGLITINQYSQTGGLRRKTRYIFKTKTIVTEWDWGLTNEIQTWVVDGEVLKEKENEG